MFLIVNLTIKVINYKGLEPIIIREIFKLISCAALTIQKIDLDLLHIRISMLVLVSTSIIIKL